MDDDVKAAFEFIRELLAAEEDSLKEKCAVAAQSIAEIEIAIRQVSDMWSAIENDQFGDGG